MLAHGSITRCVPKLRHSKTHQPSRDLTVLRGHSAGAGFTPNQLCKAYRFPQVTLKNACRIGIVSLGGTIQPGDISTAFQTWGLPAPVVTSITTNGQAPVSDPNGANTENMLDVELAAAAYSYCTGQSAELTFCSAPNDGTGIADAINALVAAGCGAISISWGAPSSNWSASDRATTEQAMLNAVSNGCTVFVASGDNSIDDGTSSPSVDFPCGSANAWAVGGTATILASDGSIASQKIWGDGAPGDEGGGGGFDNLVPLPSWQSGIVPGLFRGCPDSSANADPQTGWQILSDGSWGVLGGTSCSSPFTAGLFAALKAAGASFGNLGSLLYPKASTCFTDVTVGSNGAPATVGWDPASGNGTPNGPGLLSVLLGSISPPPPPPPPPTGTSSLTLLMPVPAMTLPLPGIGTLVLGQALTPGQYNVGFVQTSGLNTLTITAPVPAATYPLGAIGTLVLGSTLQPGSYGVTFTPAGPPPPLPPVCPAGQVWDPVTQKCVPIVVNPPPPTPGLTIRQGFDQAMTILIRDEAGRPFQQRILAEVKAFGDQKLPSP